MSVRTEFGFERTVCSCEACSRFCRFMPGMLVPADLPRLAEHLGYQDLGRFARENLLASPGALVLMDGVARRIHTLVPARQADGACKFLDSAGRCQVHAVAPFSCAFFDTHQSGREGDRRSARGLQAILRDEREEGDYDLLWHYLHSLGLTAPSPEECRRRMQKGKT